MYGGRDMVCHQVEISDRALTLLDAFARNRGVSLEEAVEQVVGEPSPTTSPNGAYERAPRETAKEASGEAVNTRPVLAFRQEGELGRVYERLLDAIELGVCDDLVRELEAEYARMLLQSQPASA